MRGSIGFLIRFPLNASKILMSKSKLIFNHYFKFGNSQKLLNTDNVDALLRIFESSDEIDNVLAGFVSDVVEDLINNDYILVSTYLLGNLNIIDNLIRHSYDTSVCKKILSSLLFMKDGRLSACWKDVKAEEVEKRYNQNIHVLSHRLFNKLNNSKHTDIAVNILSIIKDGIDTSEGGRGRIDYIEKVFYCKDTVYSLFRFLSNSDIYNKEKMSFNLCLQTLEVLLSFYPKIYYSYQTPENEEDHPASFCLAQSFVDKIEFLKEVLEKQQERTCLDTQGNVKTLLSSTRIYIAKLVLFALKLENQRINLSLSLSKIFEALSVS